MDITRSQFCINSFLVKSLVISATIAVADTLFFVFCSMRFLSVSTTVTCHLFSTAFSIKYSIKTDADLPAPKRSIFFKIVFVQDRVKEILGYLIYSKDFHWVKPQTTIRNNQKLKG